MEFTIPPLAVWLFLTIVLNLIGSVLHSFEEKLSANIFDGFIIGALAWLLVYG